MDLKSKAVDEMMERIKNGIVLRPIKQIQVDELCSHRLFSVNAICICRLYKIQSNNEQTIITTI